MRIAFPPPLCSALQQAECDHAYSGPRTPKILCPPQRVRSQLKSIQRTLAKVQDETSGPSMSAQFVAAGLALPGNEAAAAAMAAQQAAAGAAGGSGTAAAAAAAGKDAQDKARAGGAHISVAAQEAAKVPLLPVVPVEGHVPVPSTGALVCACVFACARARVYVRVPICRCVSVAADLRSLERARCRVLKAGLWLCARCVDRSSALGSATACVCFVC